MAKRKGLAEPSRAKSPRIVAFREAFAYWVRLGFISFGGPAGQIAIMQRDLVDRRKWISQERFLYALSYCMLLPGPEAQQLAIYIGWLLHGAVGGIAAGALFVLPSVFILWGLSAVYAAYGHLPAIAGVFSGLKPVVLALVVSALLRIGRRALKPRGLVFLAIAAFAGLALAHVPFPMIVAGAGLAGFAAGRMWPQAFDSASPRPAGGDAGDDDTAVESTESRRRVERARSGLRALRIMGVCLILWIVPLLLLVGRWGRESLFVAEYRFFTQAAFVTFGGAYAVLAYVLQAAVESLHWITSAQAMDGLGLAETTPGPLIMVLQFVGFMAAWNHPGLSSRLASATLGALVTTWVTFLPCFLFVFLGAPYVETLRSNRTLSAALSGITGAIVGVIANLAVVFSGAVLFPQGLARGVDLFALALSAVAFLVMLLARVEAAWVILAGGLVGLLRAALA